MALLLNRKYGSRLECLHSLLKSRYDKFGTNTDFALKDFKYDANDPHNVHNHCTQLKKGKLGSYFCPYLQKSRSTAKCYATGSVINDSTKSKAVSDIGSSLEALGFVTRDKRKVRITSKGEQWAKADFGSQEWQQLAMEGILSYGPTMGFLHQIEDVLVDDVFNYNDIYLGYPETEEKVSWEDEDGKQHQVKLSTFSKGDSNTRTMTKIVAWCLSAGLIEPELELEDLPEEDTAYLRYREVVHAEDLTIKRFKTTDLYQQIISKKINVDNPLSYSRLHKNVGAIREKGSKEVREATLKHVPQMHNRRFVFIYVLNKFSQINKDLNFTELVDEMNKYPDEFFIAGNDPYEIMATEINVGFVVGLPFTVKDDEIIVPLTTINEDVLISDAPKDIIDLAEKIWNSLK